MTATRVAAASWPAIGTTVRLVVTDPARLMPGRELLASYLAALDLACSRFRADSELARAESRAGTPVPVSEVLADAVAVALDAAAATDGDLDPTVATRLAAWATTAISSSSPGMARRYGSRCGSGPAGRTSGWTVAHVG